MVDGKEAPGRGTPSGEPGGVVVPAGVDDPTMERMIAGASMPALMMSIVHMTGDDTVLDGPARPQRLKIEDLRGRLAPDQETWLRAQAMHAVRAWRDRGWTLPRVPRATLRRMIDVCLGTPVPDEYVDLLIEEMGLEHVAEAPESRTAPQPATRRWRVLVIGAGMSGIAAAIRLIEAGHEVLIVERNPSVGGTWYENRYPGCRVDVPNHFYSYSFRPNHRWKRYFAPQPDLLAYFRDTVAEHGLAEHIRLETEVTAARWDEASAQWIAELRDKDGRTEEVRVDAVISAVGLFNRPKLPAIPGRERFGGPSFHSAQWPEDLETAGKRIAVIGSGASAFQIVPEIQKDAQTVTVFQRTPGWLAPTPDYHAPVDEEVVWCLEHLPGYARWYRLMLFWASADQLLPALKVDPEWPDLDRSLNGFSERLRQRMTEYIRRQTGDDEALFAKLLPDYPPYGKRPLVDNGAWVAALRQDHVELVTDKVEAIESNGVRDATGRLHEVDMIVYATGFDAGAYLRSMCITGRDGQDLHALWGDVPRAHLGITVPGFPNFFCLYGPGTNFGHGGSIIFMAECQIRQVLSAIDLANASGASVIEVHEDAYREYRERMEAELAQMIWSRPNVSTYYKNANGVVTTTSPFRIVDYWRWTRFAEPANYDLRRPDEALEALNSIGGA